MVNAGLTSFKKIEDTNARELELVIYDFYSDKYDKENIEYWYCY